jgi:hypothetical protein
MSRYDTGNWQPIKPTAVPHEPAAEAQGERSGETGSPKNREMKEEPTMLLITKDRFWVTHDVYENKDVSLLMPRYC